ncbi:DUF6959 family protein [Pseudomonas sp. Hp2]|uniref:DUF6959 family protein n=1 Tax=Pseudomonas sp. Hp2 TaxID=701189 RepID=UPI0035574D37
MHIRNVEIYSDQSNAVIMRHPDRRFPGVLVQGDSLYSLCVQADDACAAARGKLSSSAYDELNELRNALWNYLNHYKSVLGEHQISLPFSDGHGA